MGKTSIAWTEKSWNPIAAFDRETGKRGWFCVRVSPGCTNCYAAARNVWIGNGHDYRVPEGKHVEPRIVWKQMEEPLRWKQPSRVFVCSMTDLFFEGHTDEMIARVFGIMAVASRHSFQVLTKRPERMVHFLSVVWPVWSRHLGVSVSGLALPHVWFGISAEDQQRFDERWPHLSTLRAVARVDGPLWISYEPALGPLTLPETATRGTLDWLVVGGESGARARPFDLDWARSIIAQCRENGVAVFVKQLGAKPEENVDDGINEGMAEVALQDAKGENPMEWPRELRVREYPAASSGSVEGAP